MNIKSVFQGITCARTSLLPLLLGALLGCSGPTPPVTGTVEEETLPSQIVGDSYRILVRLPPGYDTDPSRRFPVVFQLDATSFGPEFQVIAGQASALEAKDGIEETIIVGVGYPYDDPLVDPTKGRMRDYRTDEANGKPGGAPDFLRFLREELIPHIDERYPTDPARRMISGHSLGGFFALYTMLKTGAEPSPPFSGFLAGDPSTALDGLRLFEEESALHAKTASLPAALYMPTARYDGAVQTLYSTELTKRLTADYPDLEMKHRIYDTDHGGVIAPGFADGLVFLLGGSK